ncbi:uncharacterized protein PITG_13971 [Phytophthora infestans T30-4]|uniref:Uncharacterized protein n=2 Tax=Phytophthora infestans TaxID=4787 RepID=D0NN82_PHYIT|nr:uncharacterized protein PITG_13971 [Phytophthora infestans T30-4]EEY61989.1 conserved hypothetical protein [Phytophthora infestans T30-4]KAF4031189.1 Deoxyribonuclease II [Phytophthora infestans]KAF4140837.1 Deoxyribonuclease II [Phytophthora infestans]KAI9987923.1 hypothetical protein PInf_024178 [Phytophthora infestans]|eukprot:XP_002899629.1 conserved hypothetical protein [Phytophthora infestans T30-4]
MFLRVVLLLVLVDRVAQASTIRALDGLGNAVAWWAVIKLPSHVQSPDGVVIPTPCDCPVPDCSNVATAGWSALEARAAGLCYLYADSRTPEFRHFRDVGYDCLGQGGNDPVSHTLKQKENSSYWAIFNDQLNGIASAFHPKETERLQYSKQVCGGGDLFSAHAKGAVAFQSDASGGFFLQTSTPNFPDPTRNDSFVKLGCQTDNNVHFSQHMLAMSLEDNELLQLGNKLQLARLCSANFFLNESLHDFLGSATLFKDGAEQENTSASAFYHALLDQYLPVQLPSDPMKAEFSLKLATTQVEKSRVFEPLVKGQDLFDFDPIEGEQVRVLIKSPRAAVPPWTLVAEMLDSDVSVASWWDGNYGIPTICAGDVYTHSPNEFCLNNPRTGVELNADGSAPYNIENLMQATWHMSDGSSNLTWQLVGGRVSDGNHAKWGLTTPRFGPVESANAYVTFGDLNMEGFPCSKACNGSQAGRGGSFFSLLYPRLHKSLADSVISGACRCSPPAELQFLQNDTSLPTFEELRMCHRGCVKKIEERLEPAQLPILSVNASSFWSK